MRDIDHFNIHPIRLCWLLSMDMWTSDGVSSWFVLTRWGRLTHICVSKQTIIGSDNGLLPGRRQAIIWTNDGILLIGILGTNFSEILIENRIFSFKKMGLKVSSVKWRPFCLGLNALMNGSITYLACNHQQKLCTQYCNITLQLDGTNPKPVLTHIFIHMTLQNGSIVSL